MPTFKVLIDGEKGPIEDTEDGTFKAEEDAAEAFLRYLEAVSDIAEVQDMVQAKRGPAAKQTVTREEAAIMVSLATADIIRSFRAWIDELDVSDSDRAMLVETGRELVAGIGKDLDEVVNALVGVTPVPNQKTDKSLN